MNNPELDSILKSAQPPEPPPGYWDAFPRKVTTKLHWKGESVTRPRPGNRFRALAWGLGLATACVLVGFVIGFRRGHAAALNDPQVADAQKYFQEIEGLFPHQVRAIVFDSNSAKMVLADQPDVPDSTPFYLNITGPDGNRHVITFSGQQVELNGEPCEVLADAHDHVIVVGSHHIWSEADASGAYRLTARPLRDSM